MPKLRGKVPAPSIYGNPFRNAHISPARVDMGVDFAGQGPIMALGPGIITESGNAWAGAQGAPFPGTWITEKITEGPLAGQIIYYAEDITPNVRTGQHVDASSIIGYFTGSGLIETGYATGVSGETMAAKLGQNQAGIAAGDPGRYSTAAGMAYEGVLTSLGVPAGPVERPVQGSTKGLPTSAKGSGGVTGGGSTGTGTGNIQTDSSLTSGILGGILGGSSWKDTLERFGLIVLGGALILIGIWMLAGKTASKLAVSVVAPEATAAKKVATSASKSTSSGSGNGSVGNA